MMKLLLVSSVLVVACSAFLSPVQRVAPPAFATTRSNTGSTVNTQFHLNTALFAETASHANGASNKDKKKVIVLGGDGFCGWPTALYLSDQGHDVVIVDNLSRRNIDVELGCDSLTPIQSPEVRILIILCILSYCIYLCVTLC
jgi:hypothetical protein